MTAIIDQGLIGVGSYAISLLVTREGAADEIAVYVITLQWALGASAIATEAVLVPAMVSIARRKSLAAPVTEPLAAVGFVLGTGFAILAFLLIPINAWSAVIVSGLSLSAASFSFLSARAIHLARGDISASLRLAWMRLGVLVVGLAGVVITESLVPASALGLLALGFALPLAGSAGRFSRVRWRPLWSGVRHGLQSSWLYGVITVVRIMGYTAGLLSLSSILHGWTEAASGSALLVAVAPLHVISSAVTSIWIGELARESEPAVLRHQLRDVSLLCAAMVALAVTVGDVWLDFVIGQEGPEKELIVGRSALALLAVGILLSSWLSAWYKVTERPAAMFGNVLAAATLGVLAVVIGISAPLALTVPYVVFCALAGVDVLRRLPGIKSSSGIR